MFGIGAPEALVLGVLAVILFGAFVTVDAVSRPADRYRTGRKGVWIAGLLLTNPMLTRWFGGLLWTVTLPLFLVACVAYVAGNRYRNPTPRPAWVWLAGSAAFALLIALNAALLLHTLHTAAVPAGDGPGVAVLDTPDAALLAELGAEGSDLSRPHAFAFILFLPDEAAAARAGRALRARGFAVEITESVGGGQWQARGTRMMLPDAAELVRLRGELGALAATEGGEYGGWRAPLVR